MAGPGLEPGSRAHEARGVCHWPTPQRDERIGTAGLEPAVSRSQSECVAIYTTFRTSPTRFELALPPGQGGVLNH